MPSSADPRRIAHWVDHRAQRLRRDAATQAEQARAHEQQAASLRTDADTRLMDAQVGEELGLDRQRLFDRLRAVAIARAHVLECDLRARDLQAQAEQARQQEQALRRDAAEQQSRARRLEVAGVRLRTPQEPQVVITATGADDAKRREWVHKLLVPHMPYATRIDVRTVGDDHLVAIARAGLRSRGITTRVGSQAGRTSIGNDAFLDDAALHAMARYRDSFVDEWGARRVHINIRLWDDLLKGRSYQYSDDQLLSIGEGRWEFSTSGSR